MGNPAWMIWKYAMYGHVAAYFLSKGFIIFQSTFIFFQSAFIYFRHLCYFSGIVSHGALS
jgi:hypothetical protein